MIAPIAPPNMDPLLYADTAGKITAEAVGGGEEAAGDVVRPNNTVVLVGSRVEIPCKANADNESRWDYYSQRVGAMESVCAK